MASLQLHAQDQNFWVFLCLGQSNMAGQAPIEEQDLNVSDRYLSMATTEGPDRKLGTWRKAVPPLCRADAHLGPADWFGRTLIDVVPDNMRIGIVSVAVEGCPITFFDKDQKCLRALDCGTDDMGHWSSDVSFSEPLRLHFFHCMASIVRSSLCSVSPTKSATACVIRSMSM